MPKTQYDHTQIENNWKDKWYKDNIYEAVDFSEKPKKYILAELPYPSGKYLHAGHMMRYTVPEIYSRFLRMNGYNVLYPMGWDCFGLPAETFAIKEGVTPQEAITGATPDYKKAMQNMGYAIDWNREITTSNPKYYKWTQAMFIKLWEKGLAIQKEMPVWWCQELGVLADEEVLTDKNGNKVSERGKYPVEKKMFKQWVLNIPAYAEHLLEGLERVDYEESVKTGQRNWIGKSEGTTITYDIENSSEKITVFTTRPDTNFGATFVVIAPEHELVKKITTNENKEKVEKYVKETAGKSDLERMADNKVKTGAFTGSYAINQLTNTKMPIYVADYALMNVGTGAVVGVPAHDRRDFEFAQKFNLPVILVVVTKNGDTSEIKNIEQVQEAEGTMINSGFLDGMDIHEATKKIMEYIEEKNWGKRTTIYKVRPQIFSRQRYWGDPIPLIYKQNGEIEALPIEKLPLELPVMKDFLAGEDGVSPLAKNEEWKNTTDSEGNPAVRETDTMPTWAGSNWYYMRYIDPHNDKMPADIEKLKYWMPVDMYFGDSGHTTAHLLYSRFWYKIMHEVGWAPNDEPYMYRMSGGILLGEDGQKMSKSRGNTIDPKNVMETFGADALRTHLAFIGPYEDTYPWNPRGLEACHKLVKTIYGMKDIVTNKTPEKETTKLLHTLIKKTTTMMENLKMNTTVSEIMIFVNHLKTLSEISTETWKPFIKVVAPLMPFIAEELWQEINGYTEWKKENSVHLQEWPTFDENVLKDTIVTIPVQVNGRVRENINIDPNAPEEDVKKLALASEKIQKYVEGVEIKKVIYVPGKILNLVV